VLQFKIDGDSLQLGDPQIPEAQIRRRVVSLDANVTAFEPATRASVVAFRPVVVPVGDLNTIDPGRDVIAMRDDGHPEPFAILGHFLAGRLAA
jgi:hypothetical protein